VVRPVVVVASQRGVQLKWTFQKFNRTLCFQKDQRLHKNKKVLPKYQGHSELQKHKNG